MPICPVNAIFRRAETTSGDSLGPPRKWHTCQKKRYSRPIAYVANELSPGIVRTIQRFSLSAMQATSPELLGTWLTTTAKALGWKWTLVLFAGKKMAAKNRGKMWSNEIDLWSKETIPQFALENCKTSKETREVYILVMQHFLVFYHEISH